MKNLFLNSAAIFALSIILTGCGETTADPPKTRAATTVYLFGAMSSSSKVASIETDFTVPDGIMVNYSSPPGVTNGKFPLRSGSIVPSGPVKFSQNDITSAEYNTSDRKLSIKILNTPDLSNAGITKNIRSSTTDNGVEVATIYFKLATADVIPVLPTPWQDTNAIIGEDSSSLGIIYATGLKLNFLTTFIP